ncbi:hypothetical protein LCT09_25780 [Klebsiella pneumoniae]|uniref:hypothetical protein n=1 Tax=Klebsiella pneumoniae TaxID=573 RepID=UPI00226DB457|nr:hypothetical protein [Klebsiella pneumoniae]MCY0071175.1 hypothetical protein [Klebsiella pneumoniae]
MTTDITELALIDKIQKQLENFDTVVLKEDEANALVEALEKAQAENTAGVAWMAESYETTISMLRSRIDELESRTVKLPPTFWYEHDDLSRDVPVLDKRLVKKMLREAGIKWEAE